MCLLNWWPQLVLLFSWSAEDSQSRERFHTLLEPGYRRFQWLPVRLCHIRCGTGKRRLLISSPSGRFAAWPNLRSLLWATCGSIQVRRKQPFQLHEALDQTIRPPPEFWPWPFGERALPLHYNDPAVRNIQLQRKYRFLHLLLHSGVFHLPPTLILMGRW